MRKPHRIAAGAIIIKEEKILLVRYRDSQGGSFLVGPGGGLEDDENVIQAVVRETKEETGLTVRPGRILAIEDLMCSHFKMIKVWMVCEIVEGEIQKTKDAEIEKIIETAWFTKDQLKSEKVFPPFLMTHDWADFNTQTWLVICLPSRKANF